jgi:hypothetical protein
MTVLAPRRRWESDMKRQAAVAGALCAGLLLWSGHESQAQSAAERYSAPRTSWGAPDLTGTWTNATITPAQRPSEYGERLLHSADEVAELEGGAAARVEAGNRETDPNAPPPSAGGDVGGYNRGWLDPGSRVMRVGGEPRTSLLTTADGRYPDARAPDAGGRRGGGGMGPYDNPEQRPFGERCIISFGRNAGPPMFPNGFYNNNYHFVLSKNALAINIEMVHDTRVIRIGEAHRSDDVRPWFGDSIGWWEGETLVAETTHMPERLAYRGSWENLKVIERFTRVAPDRILYQFEIHDPTHWDAPWGGEYEFGELGDRVHEYACHEGNYAMEGILAGERAGEAAAALEGRPAASR